MLIKTFIPDADAAAGFTERPGLEGWYQVIETDQPQTWGKQMFQVYLTSSTATERNFVLAGFTDQGASVNGVCAGTQLTIKRQTVKIAPKGGAGSEWNIELEGDGVFRGKTIELHYTIFQPDNKTLKGKIIAEKTSR